MRKPSKTGLAPPQRRHAREFKYGFEPRVLLDERVDGVVEIGLGVEVNGHCAIFFVVVGYGSLPCADDVHLFSLLGCPRFSASRE
jgi:hypothetical protein